MPDTIDLKETYGIVFRVFHEVISDDLLDGHPLKKQFEKAVDELEKRTPDFKNLILKNMGLSGEQFKLKWKGFKDNYGAWRSTGSIRYLKFALKWLNTILGSLSFIPGLQFLEPLKELKESLEHTIDEQIMQGRLTL